MAELSEFGIIKLFNIIIAMLSHGVDQLSDDIN